LAENRTIIDPVNRRTTMDTLYSWNARRAGGRITVAHSCGKIVGVDTIQPENGKVVATDKDGRQYALHVG
jgi:hypothetical protein